MTTGPDPMISALLGLIRTARGAGLAGTGMVAGGNGGSVTQKSHRPRGRGGSGCGYSSTPPRPLWTGTPASQDRPQRLTEDYHGRMVKARDSALPLPSQPTEPCLGPSVQSPPRHMRVGAV